MYGEYSTTCEYIAVYICSCGLCWVYSNITYSVDAKGWKIMFNVYNNNLHCVNGKRKNKDNGRIYVS